MADDLSMRRAGYEKLRIWKRATEFVAFVYRVSKRFPDDEKSGMIANVRKTAALIPTKIAAGYRADDPVEFAEAIGAAKEVIADLHAIFALARRMRYLSWMKYRRVLRELARMAKHLDKFARHLAKASAQSDGEANGRKGAKPVGKAKDRKPKVRPPAIPVRPIKLGE